MIRKVIIGFNLGAFGKIVVAIGMTATTIRFKQKMIPSTSKEVMRVASEISKKLGA